MNSPADGTQSMKWSMDCTMYTVFTWLNAAAFITLVWKIVAATIQIQHYSILENDVYTHNFEIHRDANQVRRLFKVRSLTK